MNKKLLYASILFFTGMMITVGYTNAQVCTPDPQYTQPGIYPDSIKNLDSGTVDVFYANTITAIVPVDTVDGTGLCCNPVTVDSIVVTSIVGLPPGLTSQCEPPSCGFPGGTSGCILISGTPTDTGTFSITANVTGYAKCCTVGSGCVTCFQVPQSYSVNYYTIVINPPVIASISSTDVLCFEDCIGTAAVMHSGGTAPFTYLWNTNDTTATITGLCAANYNVIVEDKWGDTAMVSITINQPADSLSATVSSTDETGPGNNDGTASVSPSGGTGPYTYSWSPGGASTDSIWGLAPDTYTVTVTDSNNCTFVGSVIVNPAGCALSIDTISSTDETIAGIKDGTATVVVSGGTPPYTYNWGIDTIVTTNTTSTITGLAPGNYSVTITDSAGCKKDAGPVSVGAGTVACPFPTAGFTSTISSLTANFTDTSTTTGTITWSWDFGDGAGTSTAQNPMYTYVSDSAYNVCLTVTDSCGNATYCDNITVTGGVGVFELFTFESIKVYPNPVVNELKIITSFDEQVLFTIYDIVGKQIKSIVLESKTTRVNTTELTEGMYIYQILSKEGIMLNKGKFSIVK